MTARNKVRFLRRGEIVELAVFPPMRTLLDYLRLDESSRGTKEGCGEGDCGACTVALGSLENGKLVYEPVNACILLLGQIDGKELVTVDDLAAGREAASGPAGAGRPSRLAMRLLHAGLRDEPVHALSRRAANPTARQIVDQLAGNLCRCTGYRPIVDAALDACSGQSG